MGIYYLGGLRCVLARAFNSRLETPESLDHCISRLAIISDQLFWGQYLH